MKRIFTTLAFSFYLLTSVAQEKEMVRYNTTENNQNDMVSHLLKYPQFTRGRAFLRNGTKGEALFNYNYDNNEILFINGQKDTLAFDTPEQYEQVVIATDTFLYSKQGFLQVVSSSPFCQLLVKRNLVMVGSEKKAAYGGYSATSSTAPIKTFSDGTFQHSISTDENFYYRLKEAYYFADRFHQIFPVNKKGVRDLGWKKEKELKEFIEQNRISFEKKEDLFRLMAFFQSAGPN